MDKKIFLLGNYIPVIKKTFHDYGYLIQEGCLEKDAQDSDMVFSVNYEPKAAAFCHKYQKKYVCWIVDCPHTVLYSKTFYYNTNFIFLFDYNQFCMMKDRGGDDVHVFYLPLATDIVGFQKVINESVAKRKKYQSDISFVGRLYRDKDHALFDAIKYLPPYVEGYLDSLMKIQRKMWGIDLLIESINNQVWNQLKEYVKWDLRSDYDDNYKETAISIIQQKIAQQERMEMCSMLAEEFNFALYTQDSTEFDRKIDNRGYVDYLEEMPLVFASSRININVTLRSISSGIPLRCLDIMACGGFLLTNYQAELAEYFVDGEELVFYNDFQDMKEKVRYYLNHDEERKYIAEKGMEKVAREFSYEKQIGVMIETLEGV